MTKLSIILADDHNVMRQSLLSLLERELLCKVVAEASDGLTAVELVAQYMPDVLIVDLMMPGLTGIEVIRQVRIRSPQTRIVVLSMYANEMYVREALRAGALAYVLKESQAAEFVGAVSEAAFGRRYLCRILAERIDVTQVHDTNALVSDSYELLTERERDVLRLAALGHTASEIAVQLHLSTRTVETYRSNVLQKLDLRNNTELVRYALKRGIISLM